MEKELTPKDIAEKHTGYFKSDVEIKYKNPEHNPIKSNAQVGKNKSAQINTKSKGGR